MGNRPSELARGRQRTKKARRVRRPAQPARTARRYRVGGTPNEMSPEQIAVFRRETLGVSQALFANLMNVAVQTVHAWEQGNRRPSGTALRLLHMACQEPGKLQSLVREMPRDSATRKRVD